MTKYTIEENLLNTVVRLLGMGIYSLPVDEINKIRHQLSSLQKIEEKEEEDGAE